MKSISQATLVLDPASANVVQVALDALIISANLAKQSIALQILAQIQDDPPPPTETAT
jgi:hypothetical protein